MVIESTLFVLLSHSTQYQVWISRLGEVEISSSDTESGLSLLQNKPLLGSLFKSQNAFCLDTFSV